MGNLIEKWLGSSLILKFFIGLIIGAKLGIDFPEWSFIGFPGQPVNFVGEFAK